MNTYFANQLRLKRKEVEKWFLILALWLCFVAAAIISYALFLSPVTRHALPWYLPFLVFILIGLLPVIPLLKKAWESQKLTKDFQRFDPQGWKKFNETE